MGVEVWRVARLIERICEDPLSNPWVPTLREVAEVLHATQGIAVSSAQGATRIRAATGRPSESDEDGAFDIEAAAAIVPNLRAAFEGGAITTLTLPVAEVARDSTGAAAQGFLHGPGFAVVVPLTVGERSVGLLLLRRDSQPYIDDSVDATVQILAQIGAGFVLKGAPDPRHEESNLPAAVPAAPAPASGSGAIDRRATPVWGVLACGERRRRLIVAEDDASIADGLRDALELEGYAVETYESGEGALQAALRAPPDLMLLDVRLPERDGFSVARALIAERRTSTVPVLFLSGTEDLAIRVRSLQHDSMDFLPKPFLLKDLLTRVQQALLRAESRSRLHFSARIDDLTGLGNIRLFEERLATEAARIDRYGTPLAIAVLDLDKLKSINDKHGHAAGSDVLRAVGDVLRKAVRETDLAARYGGDEFVVLLPHTELEHGEAFAERVRSTIAHLVPGGIPVTVSIGVACFDPNVDTTVKKLFERADQAAYRAKRAGGNRIEVDGRAAAAEPHARPVPSVS